MVISYSWGVGLMVDQIVNNEILTNSSIRQQQELLGIEKKSASKNPYEKNIDLTDESEISDEAIQLYKKEQEIEKYRNLVLESIDNDLNTSDILELIHSDYKNLSDADLAEGLTKNKDFMDLLLSKELPTEELPSEG